MTAAEVQGCHGGYGPGSALCTAPGLSRLSGVNRRCPGENSKRDLKAVYEPPAGSDSPGQILGAILQDRNTLEYMRLHLDVETVEVVVNAILHASRLFVVGEGSAGYMAEGFALQMLILVLRR